MRKKGIFLRDRKLLPIAIWFAANLLAYYGGRILTRGRVFFDFTTSLDRQIPIWTPAVIVYLATFAFWIIGFFYVAKGDEKHYYHIMAGELVAKALCLVIFVLFPTQKALPEITGSSPTDQLLKLVYLLDEPNVLFPSIHCLDSYFVFRGSFRQKHLKKVTWLFSLVMAIAIFASTLLTGQHVIVDIVAAVAVAELGLLIAKCFKLGNKYEAILMKESL